MKIQILKTSFHLFSFLADKTNGWALFAKPKILLGSLILSLTACTTNTAPQTSQEQPEAEKPDSIEAKVEEMPADTLPKEKTAIVRSKQAVPDIIHPDRIICYDPIFTDYDITFPEPVIMCYEPASCYIGVVPQPPKIYTFVSEMPTFPGGNDALVRFIRDNLTYPRADKEMGVQGTVPVRFVINEDGTLTDAKVIRSVSPGLDAEALRLVRSMPRWVPGKQNGEVVKVQFDLPIRFVIQNEDTKTSE